MSMALDEAIKHCEEVAEQNESSAITYKNCKEIKANMYEKLTAEKAENDCRECAADHRQLAEWLTELKDLREENKVLMQECDRLIKEKGELLSKVSGGDVLRICQLEDQLQAELDNSHCLEIELTEAKQLLKAAVEDIHDVLTSQIKITNYTLCEKCKYYLNCNCKDKCIVSYNLKQWRFADEALKLIGETNEP